MNCWDDNLEHQYFQNRDEYLTFHLQPPYLPSHQHDTLKHTNNQHTPQPSTPIKHAGSNFKTRNINTSTKHEPESRTLILIPYFS